MDLELAKKILAAIEANDNDALAAICKDLIAAAASASDPAAAGAGDEDPAAAAADDPAEPAADAEPEEEEAASMAALGRVACELTGQANPAAARDMLRKLVSQVNQLASERAALEDAERRDLVGRLVQCGAETPATAWQRDDKGAIPEGAKRKPCKRLASEPIAELRERVETLEGERGRSAPRSAKRAPAAPAEADGRTIKTSRGEVKLSAREIKNCEAQGADVNAYAENKAIREAAKQKQPRN